MMMLNFKGTLLSLSSPVVMGILNYTDDSFFDGGRYCDEKTLLRRAGEIVADGAKIIDIGAVSTRPGAAEISEETEFARIRDAVRWILRAFPEAIISVDTWRSEVAEMAIGEGAAMINDISAGTFDEKMLETIGALKVPYCMMHTTGKPDEMQNNTRYDHMIAEILQFFGEKIEKLKMYGVNDIIIDPGFGFGKTLNQNYALLKNLHAFKILNLPILVGMSRKSMLYKLLEITPEKALNGTTVINTIALEKGANILRVHDVKEAVEVVKIYEELERADNDNQQWTIHS